ncbi:MAG: phosphoribosylanthranilate isomerase, partial [Desulfobacula sp.]|nr:phosphoribosylanthranilate isomerase [Desulfobacula sp.]
MEQTFIKICGIKNPHEANECIKLGAHAIGIVFFKKSPRNMNPEDAKELCALLPDKTITTGVFVDETYDYIMETASLCKLKAVQLHGNESPDLVMDISRNGIKVIKALFKQKEPLLEKIRLYEHAWACLVEKGHGNLPGGTAQKWDWNIDNRVSSNRKIIIAGGLEPGNVAQAIAASTVFGVDVSSGVESSPGTKDLYKVKKFIQKVQGKKAD